MSEPRVSVLIVSYNTRELLLEAIDSVVHEPDVEVVVVDNASTDGSADAVANTFQDVCLVRSEHNLGFAGGTNAAARAAHGQNLLLLNPDARLTPGALDGMLQLLHQQARAGAVGPAMVYPNGRAQSAAFRFPGLAAIALDLFPIDRLMDTRLNGRVHQARVPTRVDYVLGACMLIRGAAWQDVGPLDEGYFMYLEEIDWCQRARRRGWQVWYAPAARAVHHAGAATSQHAEAMQTQLWRSRLRYYQRFHGPLYNRLMRAVIGIGAQRRPTLEPVRQLTK